MNTSRKNKVNPIQQISQNMTRRQLLGSAGLGLGAVALGTLLDQKAHSAEHAKTSGGLTHLPHFAPKAKRVIYLFQNGAPSHVDLFDHKPMLDRMDGKPIPEEIVAGKRFSTMTNNPKGKLCRRKVTKFGKFGESGQELAGNFLPQTASIADDICLVRSMNTTQVNHAPAITYFLTGSEQAGKPSMGAWLTYGLGSETEDLPSFVVMTSRDKQNSCGQIFYDFYWGSGFLPSKFQGVQFRGSGDPVLYLTNPEGISRKVRRGQLDDLAELNRMNLDRFGDPEIATRIAQYELAYKMQASVPELTDIKSEPEHILKMYGPDVQRKGSYAYNCLLARRLAERGSRFIQLMHAGWDQHKNIDPQLKIQCDDTDAPSAALIKDLKQRGLLEDTLVIWGGEFGRTPFAQGRNGRDHHPYAFTIWMAGGGIKPGFNYGTSDEFGHDVTENPVSVHDLQATILHLLGINHERFSFPFQGLDQRLTGVEEAHIIKPILA